MDYVERERELEELALARGQKTFYRRLDKARERGQESRFGATRRLLQESTEALEEYLKAWLSTSKRGRKHTARKWVERVGPAETAFLTSRAVLDRITVSRDPKQVAPQIASMLLQELRCRRMEELAPGLYQYKIESFQGSSYAHMARSMDAAMRHGVCDECFEKVSDLPRAERLDVECPHLDMDDLRLPYSEKLKIGYKLIDSFIEATGLFERTDEYVQERGYSRPTAKTVLTPKPEVVEWLENRNENLSLMMPSSLPMVVPPMPWGKGKQGGYWFSMAQKYDFIRGSRYQKKWVEESATQKVEEAVNRIQETPWQINSRVLEVLEEVVRRGGEMAGIPRMEAEELPAKPEDIAENEESRRRWAKEAGEVRDRNAQILGVAKPVKDALWVANEFRDEEVMWFPHSLDFRGRVYPIPSLLSPQGPDHHKGLLQFADSAPVGKRGAWWMKVHGANCLGEWDGQKVGMMTLDERVRLIEEIEPGIQAVAEDPWQETFWMEADEPFQFLAFCLDYAGYLEEGETYESKLVVSMDGSNNGLQHLSAMLRDPVGAEAVNVRNNDTPRDVYTEVMEDVLDRLEREAVDNELAQLWLSSGEIDRKLFKRPVMTFPYGSKTYGFTDQIYEELKTRDNWEEIEGHFVTLDKETGELLPMSHKAFTYLAGHIWDALQYRVVAAAEAMEWLQEVSRYVSESGRAIKWVVPETDFPVVQDAWRYFKQDLKQIETKLAGRVVRPSYYKPKDEVDSRKQANAISPNFVHSLDAAVLMLTVLQTSHDGLEHFAMVHDSYGTLAADAEILNRATREVFYNFYRKHDVLEEFYYQVLDQVDPELIPEVPEPPSMGSLNLDEVLFSDYFFS